MQSSPARPRALEWCGVLLILLAGLLPRLRDVRAPFDREFEGAQGAFFAIAVINYERLGATASGGYPVLNLDLGVRGDPATSLWEHPLSWYVYPNHPPLVPAVAWLGASLGGPTDLAGSAARAQPPAGLEPALRAPFVIANVLAMLGLWWALRSAAGPRRGLLGLALFAALPLSIFYATLINYEAFALCGVAAVAIAYVRWVRGGGQRGLVALAWAFFAGSCVTFAGMFFLPAFALHALARLGWRPALRMACACAPIGLVPLMLHSAWADHVQRGLGLDPPPLLSRARELWAPLLDSSAPLSRWVQLQLERGVNAFGWAMSIAALLGALSILAQALRRRSEAWQIEREAAEIELTLPLLVGGVAYLFGFYRHTFDPQTPFLLICAPAIVAAGARALDRLADRLPPRAAAPACVAASLAVCLPGLWRANEMRFDHRARPGEPFVDRTPSPLPLPDATGAEFASLMPPGAFGVHPACVGLNLAASYYAWRSLWPANSPNDPMPAAVASRFGMGAAPRVLLLPRHPWPAIAEPIAAFEREWVRGAAPDRVSENWRAFDLH